MARCSRRTVFAVSSTAPSPRPLVAPAGLYPTIFEPPSLGVKCFYACVSGWHVTHWDLVMDCSPETTQTFRKNKAVDFVFPSIFFFFKRRLWLICLHNIYMPFALDLYLHGLTWIFWLHFWGLKKIIQYLLLLFDRPTYCFLWFCNFSSPYEVLGAYVASCDKPKASVIVGFQKHRKTLVFCTTHSCPVLNCFFMSFEM